MMYTQDMSTHPFAIGDTFGSLTIEKLVGRKSAMARCTCGGLRSCSASELLSGRLKSCGCRQWIDRPHPIKNLAGQRFGQWTARHALDRAVGDPTYWRCICSCGREGKVRVEALLSGKSRRCRSCAGRASHHSRARREEKNARR
jgi:hypothetical protein